MDHGYHAWDLIMEFGLPFTASILVWTQYPSSPLDPNCVLMHMLTLICDEYVIKNCVILIQRWSIQEGKSMLRS